MYGELRHRLQKGTIDYDVDYHLMKNGWVIFRDKIYVLDHSGLKKFILREFHVKPYLGHPRYRKTLEIMKKFYYWSNLKKEVVDFVARCFDCQKVKSEYKHPVGLIQPIAIPEWK